VATEDDKRHEQWSPAEWRLLVITFVATFAANILTVISIGVAIGLARLSRENGLLKGWPDYAFVSFICVASIAQIVILVRSGLRGFRPSEIYDARGRYSVIITAVNIVWLTLVALVFVGILAGVK
jgi:hypothetical protein